MTLTVILHTPLPEGDETTRFPVGVGTPPMGLGPRHEHGHSYLRVGWHDPEDPGAKPLDVGDDDLYPYGYVLLVSGENVLFRGFIAEITHKDGRVVGFHAAHFDYLDIWQAEEGTATHG